MSQHASLVPLRQACPSLRAWDFPPLARAPGGPDPRAGRGQAGRRRAANSPHRYANRQQAGARGDAREEGGGERCWAAHTTALQSPRHHTSPTISLAPVNLTTKSVIYMSLACPNTVPWVGQQKGGTSQYLSPLSRSATVGPLLGDCNAQLWGPAGSGLGHSWDRAGHSWDIAGSELDIAGSAQAVSTLSTRGTWTRRAALNRQAVPSIRPEA